GRYDFGFNRVIDPALKRYEPDLSGCLAGQPTVAGTPDWDQPGYTACHGLAFFDYKTGAYADHVRGEHASTAERLALWNGAGRRTTTWNGHTVVDADANNHANKVLEMHRALSDPMNAQILAVFRGAGGVFDP